ncbi:hypothetical protein MK852_13775 [Shewanella benthica]|uniref:hypothetical protein n=1 Tax=Shewanella benthica TaxID=43661 RepID=UPI00187AAA80|nr:hypothetical protein [Shewanella benthica]MBE7214733.1 hypothetical protein [Shewanella benthica]MCL1063177.1 hypothetical protein [Shewanella benthica]
MVDFTQRNKNGLQVWPILFCLLTVVILIFGVHYYHLSEDGIDLVCKGHSYGQDASDDLELLLTVETNAKQVILNYQFSREENPLGQITFRGVLDTLDVASMTYRLLIDEGELQLSFAQKTIPPHMSSIIDWAKQTLTYSKTASLHLHIIDMDSAKGYAVIQFNPGDGIWICDLD